MRAKFDVIVMGGGHNGLVAANYLAKAGKKVLILEAAESVGGATQSVKAFPEFEANLSRYAYLVSLLPDQIVKDLELNFTTLSRKVSSYTPYINDGKAGGLFVARDWDSRSQDSFRALTGSDGEAKAWQDFYREIGDVMKRIAPTMLQELPTRAELKKLAANEEVWNYLFERPLGEVLDAKFSDDYIKGVILTDGLVGTYASAFDIQSNICFLYHLIGNGTGEWKVPQGGMGAIIKELMRISEKNDVDIRVKSRVVAIDAGSTSVLVETVSGESFEADYLLSGASSHALNTLMSWPTPQSRGGAQMKINMLLTGLPPLKSGDDSSEAFAGTFHINEKFTQFEKAFADTASGKIPEVLPAEMYCHTLTDPSILSQELIDKGYQTLTLFGFHTPVELFEGRNDELREKFLNLALEGLNQYLEEPIENFIARNSDGSLAIEAKTPLDIESEIEHPRGNIFHQDLTFPFKEDGETIKWGVETSHPRIFICGSSARRGGGVSGIPGHNAAMAVLNA